MLVNCTMHDVIIRDENGETVLPGTGKGKDARVDFVPKEVTTLEGFRVRHLAPGKEELYGFICDVCNDFFDNNPTPPPRQSPTVAPLRGAVHGRTRREYLEERAILRSRELDESLSKEERDSALEELKTLVRAETADFPTIRGDLVNLPGDGGYEIQ